MTWGDTYPGDGQEAFGFITIFTIISIVATALFFFLGSLSAFLLRRQPPRYIRVADCVVFTAFFALLIYAGVTATYAPG